MEHFFTPLTVLGLVVAAIGLIAGGIGILAVQHRDKQKPNNRASDPGH